MKIMEILIFTSVVAVDIDAIISSVGLKRNFNQRGHIIVDGSSMVVDIILIYIEGLS